MNHFSKQPAGLRGVAWVGTIPGGFISFSDRTGVARLWNVSQSHPTTSLKTLGTGITALTFIPGSDRFVCTFKDGMVGVYSVSKRRLEWSTQGGHSETVFDCKFCTTDPNVLATASYDATVRLWDVASGASIKTFATGVKCVLYCVAWSSDGTRIASGSSDGKVFIFDANAPDGSNPLKVFDAHSAAIYHIAWNPAEPSFLASSSGDGFLAVTRVTDGTVIQRIQLPGMVYGCDWWPSATRKHIVAVGCQDGIVHVMDLNTPGGSVKWALKGHKAKVFNVAWSPLIDGRLMSGSDDKTIRVWDVQLPTPGTAPTAGTSGNFTEVAVLVGHTSNVRALEWHSELPWVVVSGSWDASIRVWDTRTSACLAVSRDHHADVYGLTAHPSRPFVFASSSRDTTVRMWSADHLFPSLRVDLLLDCLRVGGVQVGGDGAGADSSENIGKSWRVDNPAVTLAQVPPGSAPLAVQLAGAGSARLLTKLREILRSRADSAGGSRGGEGLSPDALLDACSVAFGFLDAPGCAAELWELARMVVMGKMKVGNVRKPVVPHMDDVRALAAAKAEEAESVRGGKFRGVGAVRKEDSLREAAAIHIKLGNVRKYCEIMKEVGEWDAALIASPAVSVGYWQQLVAEYAAHKENEAKMAAEGQLGGGSATVDYDALVPLFVVSAQPRKLLSLFTSQGAMEDAFLAAKVAMEGRYPPHYDPSMADSSGGKLGDGKGGRMDGGGGAGGGEGALGVGDLRGIRGQMAERYATQGEPVAAACCHLSVGDVDGAVAKLVKGNCIEAALALATALSLPPDRMDNLRELAILRCQSAGLWSPALSFARSLSASESASTAVQRLAAHYRPSRPADDPDVASFYARAGLPAPSSFSDAASHGNRGAGGPAAVILAHALARQHEQAAQAAVEHLRMTLASRPGGIAANQAWPIADLLPVLRSAHCVSAESLPPPLRAEFLAYVALLAAAQAMRDGLAPPVVHYLLVCARQLAGQLGMGVFPVSPHEMALREMENLALSDPDAAARSLSDLAQGPQASAEVKRAAELALSAISKMPPAAREARAREAGSRGAVFVAGASIPSGGVRHVNRVSLISGEKLHGPAVLLEDGSSLVSLAEAVMWARVCPFSPLLTGKRMPAVA
eukprot:jgi/Mesvir1/16853/Mv15740-RA.3